MATKTKTAKTVKTINRTQLVDLINEQKGSTFFSCVYESEHKQKKGSPYRNVRKFQKIAGAFNWNYGKHRAEVTGDTDYVVKEHAWAQKDADGNTVKFGNFILNKSNQLRLQMHVRAKDRNPVYIAEVNGQTVEVDRDALRAYDYAKSGFNPTECRSLAVESMHTIRIGKADYDVQDSPSIDYLIRSNGQLVMV